MRYLSLARRCGLPITLGASKPKWQIARGAAFLLKVFP